ncbi:MAG TPA: gluconeogenesis factor YvcK family protein [Phototrophicaceae bacterium]|nr:gluconeogenesis factor YvcK family protein [Phototrophicaceae bacterium]
MTWADKLKKWLTPGIGIKRWLILLLLGVVMIAGSFAAAVLKLAVISVTQRSAVEWLGLVAVAVVGLLLIGVALVRFANNILAPYRARDVKPVVDVVYRHSRRQKGIKVVAIGGGTGLPSVLKGLKAFTTNLTAVVTVADDGGSSGRLRRDLGVLPPGDLRNNIAALADDENLMTQLFQYRFQNGDLGGHAFGNLFISALSGVTGSLETALIETERVLNIAGRVLPATLEDVHLSARVRKGNTSRVITGESSITAEGGKIEQLMIVPDNAAAYEGSVQAIREADFVIIGPGSLYTSILPNLLVAGIADALRTTRAYKIYVCNIATQPGETDDFTVADHVLALEKHIGRGMFQLVLANNAYPTINAGVNTRYVKPMPDGHEILQRYEVCYADLVDADRPWRHDPNKLVQAIVSLTEPARLTNSDLVFVQA